MVTIMSQTARESTIQKSMRDLEFYLYFLRQSSVRIGHY